MTNNLERLRDEFIEWIRENFGHGGNPGTDEQDNAVADFWITKITALHDSWVREIKGKEQWVTTSDGDEGMAVMSKDVLAILTNIK